MEVKTYTDDDLRSTEYRDGDEPLEFIADIPGDNPDLLEGMDNHEVRDRLKEFGIMYDGGVRDDCESCCSYYYFKDKATGRRFINKLNQYLLMKAELNEAARNF
jgi:hypothetical protein